MKVYVLLDYVGENCKILDVYASEGAAFQRMKREQNLDKTVNPAMDDTYHIIKKSVKGLGGINFEIKGKERVLFVTNKRKKK